jgi:hypothetical protein
MLALSGLQNGCLIQDPVIKTQGSFFLSFATLHFSLLIFLRVATLCHMTPTLKDAKITDHKLYQKVM